MSKEKRREDRKEGKEKYMSGKEMGVDPTEGQELVQKVAKPENLKFSFGALLQQSLARR